MADKMENIDIQFFQLVFSLQTAAMQQLGKIVSPMTGKVERDMSIAKTTIDILGMIEKKTKGNLTAEEARFIAHSLHELRLNFVDEVKKGEPKASPDSIDEKKPQKDKKE
jgi:hypothetical protein